MGKVVTGLGRSQSMSSPNPVSLNPWWKSKTNNGEAKVTLYSPMQRVLTRRTQIDLKGSCPLSQSRGKEPTFTWKLGCLHELVATRGSKEIKAILVLNVPDWLSGSPYHVP